MALTDFLVKATAADKTIRASAAVTTELADEARNRHKTAPTASAALGRALTASILLTSTLKEEEKLSLQFIGNGPLGGIFVEASARGGARGFVYNPRVHLPLKKGKLDVGGAMGAGTLTVIRDQPWRKEPYRSILPIVSGEIGSDIAHYLLNSEQIPSAVSLGVFVKPDETVTAAGGFIVQVMPGASPETLAQLETNVARSVPISQLVREGATPAEIIAHVLGDLAPTIVGEMRLCFMCRCSRERVLGTLVALGQEEVHSIVEKEGRITVTCEFCNERYVVEQGEVEELFATVTQS